MTELVAIFDPQGRIMAESVRDSRRAARRSTAATHGVKWNDLWRKGYRIHRLTADDVMSRILVAHPTK